VLRGTTPHDLAKDGDDKKVFVALLSGKDCECLWLQDRTIRQLKEEAQQKLDLTIKSLIGPNMEPLDEEKMLAEENVMPGTTLTVVAVNQAAEDEKEAAECGNDILQAAATGHLGGVRHLLRTVPGAVAATNRGGATALHCAADEGHAEICRVLLAAGADVDARAEEGSTPLHYAAYKGHVETVKLLLEAKASVTVKDNQGSTPLHYAAYKGHVETVKLLLEAKASVTVKDNQGQTPLDHARRKGHDEVVKILENAA